jgi:protein-tyrosine phosphatase
VSADRPPRILFVCLGNICRSPAAEGVFRARAATAGLDCEIDSAGTGAWHAGKPPDPRMIHAAAARGIDISGQRARQVDTGDFYVYDMILAMDASNLADLREMAPADAEATVGAFLDFAEGGDVPDPYYGGADGFGHVLDLIERAADGLVARLKADD